MKARRSIAGFMAAVVLCFSVIVPVREARAIVPLVPLVPLALAFVNAAGAVLASDALLATGTSILGGIAMAAIFLTPGDSSQKISIPLTKAASDADTVVPAPVASASTSLTSVTNYQIAGRPIFSSSGAACSDYISWGSTYPCSNTPLIYANVNLTSSSGGACSGTSQCGAMAPSNFVQPYSTSVTNSCSPGYTVSGSSCVLSNSRQAVSDGRSDLFVNSSGGLSWRADKDTPPTNVSLPSGCNGCGRIWGVNNNGQPFVTTITPNAAGGSDIVTQTQYSSAGSTGIRTDTIAVSPAGVVTSTGSVSAPGSMSASGTDGVAPTVTTSGRTASDPIVFPDDYARQNTLTQVVTNTGKIADALTTPATGVVDPTLPGQSDFSDHFFQGTFTNLLGWRLPSHSSQCPTSSFLVFNCINIHY